VLSADTHPPAAPARDAKTPAGKAPIKHKPIAPAPQPRAETAKESAEPPQLFKVVIRSEAGSIVRAAGRHQTAAPAQRGNQAQADFQLAAGAHRVTCTDAVTNRSMDIVIRVGEGEKNEIDCFPP
jgi:hypothetical protein